MHTPDQPPPAWLAPFLGLGEALRFLTIIPQPYLPPMSERGMASAIPYFPAAGAFIGLLLAGLHSVSGFFWAELVAATVAVVCWGAITGGLHLDGVSDTFDAVMSWRPRERKLEIMKDSRIGAMGALAVIAVFALKIAFLTELGWQAAGALVIAPVLGRWAGTCAIFFFPAAREGGLGRDFNRQVRRRDFLIALGAALIVVLLVGQWAGLSALLAVAASTWLLATWWVRDLGGLTGDTYGAVNELGEVVALATLAAIW